MISPTTLRLEDAQLGSLQIDNASGYILQTYNLGWPSVREVMQNKTDANGARDRTVLHGPRAFSVAVQLNSESSGVASAVLRDRLAAFAHPARRPVAYLQEAGDSRERLLRLRGTTVAVPMMHPLFNAMTVSWIVPSGVIESAARSTFRVNAADLTGADGITFPITFPISWPTAIASGSGTLTTVGNADTPPVLRIYGPCTDPVVVHVEQEKQLAFTGLTIAAGQFLEVDVDRRTVLYQGNTNDPRYDTLDFSVSEWWQLLPGQQTIRFLPATSSPPSLVELEWADMWL